ncbi:MAG TPA: hypothetical protein VIL01_13375 [Thermomicrobiales bacterium]
MKSIQQPIPNDLLSRLSRGATAWILGTGFLSFHVGVFALTAVCLLLWDLYRSPGDIAVDAMLWRWGVILILHAIAVAAGWVAWRLLRVDLVASADETTHLPLSGWPSSETRQLESPASLDRPELARTRAGRTTVAAASAVAEEWARRWLRESKRLMTETVNASRRVVTDPESGIHASSNTIGPTVSEWSAAVARRARGAIVAARDHVSSAIQSNGEQREPTSAAEPSRDPASTWPSRTQQPTVSAPSAPRANGASLADTLRNNGARNAGNASSTQREVDPLRTASGLADEAATGTDGASDPRWAWVEAAAAAWLARRESDIATPSQQTPPPDNSSTSAS